MGWFRRIFRRENERKERARDEESLSLNRSVGYMYLIIGGKLLLVFVIMAIMMFIGAVISTPWWIFVAIFIAGVSVSYYLYRKAKKKWEDLKAAIRQINLADKNYEISIMGGMLTMRVEQRSPPGVLEVVATPSGALPAPSEDEVTADDPKLNSGMVTSHKRGSLPRVAGCVVPDPWVTTER